MIMAFHTRSPMDIYATTPTSRIGNAPRDVLKGNERVRPKIKIHETYLVCRSPFSPGHHHSAQLYPATARCLARYRRNMALILLNRLSACACESVMTIVLGLFPCEFAKSRSHWARLSSSIACAAMRSVSGSTAIRPASSPRRTNSRYRMSAGESKI